VPSWAGWRRPPRLTLRGRLTLVATVVIAAGVVLGSVLLDVALDRALQAEVHDAALAQARDLADEVDARSLTAVLPRAGGTAAEQVLDARGAVVSSTPGAEEATPLLSGTDLERARQGRTVDIPGSVIGHVGALRVVGEVAGPAGARRTVLVASSLAPIERTERVVRGVLLIGGPLVLAGVAVVCWLVVGSALRPVDALRRGADEISGSQSNHRLPVPDSQDELRRLAETLNNMLDRLDRSSIRQRAFISDAAHELRSPLTGIRTQLDVTRQHPHTSAWEDTADDVMSEVDRLSRLVDDLLLLARQDEDLAVGRSVGPVDLAELADTVVLRRPGTARRGGGRRVIVNGDADGLTRVLDNLVANARRHTASGVTVDVRLDGSAAVLTVTDDGPGIAPEDRERVFERFTRLDEARSRDAGGSGLGLAIVREIVEAHRGTVTLLDAGPGLRVVIRLPAAPCPASHD
jgi:signal transduction histidine kinase